MTGPRHLRHGARAEDVARAWLETQGLRCVERNFRCRAGEIDLIMRDRGCLVFVEVRYRQSSSHGGPLASISRAKQQRIVRAAAFYLLRHRALGNLPIRFDAVGMTGSVEEPVIDWRRRAFDTDVS